MLNRLLDWFEQHKVAVIGTLALHTIGVFLFTVWNIRTTPTEDERSEMRIEVLSEPEMEELLQDMANEEQGIPQRVTNLTSNVTAEVKPAFSQEQLAERVENELRQMEQEEFDRLAQERRDRGEEVEMPTLDPSKWNKELYMEKAAEPVKVEGATTVWHDLDNPKRVHRHIKVPAYICKGFGQVVVYVELDPEGNVTTAKLDARLTTTQDECMLDRALTAARTARFAPNASAPARQAGNVYFRFMPQ
jgi:hypothetical protein